jgi:hypothetical protein
LNFVGEFEAFFGECSEGEIFSNILSEIPLKNSPFKLHQKFQEDGWSDVSYSFQSGSHFFGSINNSEVDVG